MQLLKLPLRFVNYWWEPGTPTFLILSQEKEVIALGINFSSAEKKVADWRAVPYRSLLVDV